MALNSTFSVDGSTVVQAHSCAYGATVTFVIQDLTGVKDVAWSIVGTSESTQSAPSITLSGTPTGQTATVTMPADPGDGLGRSFGMKLTVANARESSTTYRVFGAANAGGIIPVVAGEELWRSATHGSTDVFNQSLAVTGIALGVGAATGDKLEWNGSIWVKRRGWITPDIDLTGATDATAAIQAAMDARPGSCVSLPDGKIKVDGNLTLPLGTTLTGAPSGSRAGYKTFSLQPDHGGTTILPTSTTGDLFTLQSNSTVVDIGVHYPNQVAEGTPTAYGNTFFIANNGHYASILNCWATNPYKLIQVGESGGVAAGARIDNIISWPLSRGIVLGRIPDVARITNVHFNPSVLNTNATATALRAWVAANGVGFLFDGADQFDVTDCFAYGYQFGLWLTDADADGWLNYGTWKGGGFDACAICVNSAAASAHGVKFVGSSFAIASAGTCFKFTDTATPASAFYRPGHEIMGCTIGGGTVYHRAIWVTSGSYATVRVSGGLMINFDQYGARADGANALVLLDGVRMPTTLVGSASRISGTGVTEVNDIST